MTPFYSVLTDVNNLCRKIEFKNPAIMEDNQSKQTERFSIITKGRDYFLLQDDKSK